MDSSLQRFWFEEDGNNNIDLILMAGVQIYRNMPDHRTWQVKIKLVRRCFRHIGQKSGKICSLLRSGNNFLFVGQSNSVFKSQFFLQ